MPLRQSVGDYVESFHAHAPFARARMRPAAAAAFDTALGALVRKHLGETVELAVRGSVVWGRPLRLQG